MPKYRVQLSDGRIVTVEGAQPPTEADVLAQLGPRPQQTAAPAAVAEPDGESWTDTAIKALPTIGGTVGSFAGGGKWNPLGMAGAALGGTAGEAIKQTANAVRGRMDLVPRSAGEQLKSMMAAGAVQGGLEGVGRGVVAPVAKGVYSVAMRPVKALRDKYGLGTLINEGFERGVMPTKGGAAKAGAQMQESKAAQDAMAAAYDARPTMRLDPKEAVRRGLDPVYKKAAAIESATGVPAGVKRIQRQAATVIKRHPAGMSASEMKAAQRASDDVADPAFLAAAKGGPPVDPGSKAAVAKGWSKGYRETLNEAVGPEYAKQGRTTKSLFGVKRMADYAAERPEQLTNLFALGGGVASSGGDVGEGIKNTLITKALLSPRIQAGTALAMRPAALYGTRGLDALTGSNAEQLLREALLAQLGQ